MWAVLPTLRQNLSQPGHGSIEAMQVQIGDALDCVVLPLRAGALAARREEAMQHGRDNSALDENSKRRSASRAVRPGLCQASRLARAVGRSGLGRSWRCWW